MTMKSFNFHFFLDSLPVPGKSDMKHWCPCKELNSSDFQKYQFGSYH